MAVVQRAAERPRTARFRAAAGAVVILTVRAMFGSAASLDFTTQFGESVELECFQFVAPPIEFRLVRKSSPLQGWQAGNTEMYDLQHGPGVHEWKRDGHSFLNDLQHRYDVMTCGVLSKQLSMETRGLGGEFILQVWPRETTIRAAMRILG